MLEDAAAKFAAAGVRKDRRTIVYSGGGISATIDLFLLHQLGFDDLTLCDGSMGEWARDAACRSRRSEVRSITGDRLQRVVGREHRFQPARSAGSSPSQAGQP